MTATNVAQEASREAGRISNQPVRAAPIDVDATLAMDDVPEADKSLRWYSITIGMPGANMPAMWFDIIGAWMTDTPAVLKGLGVVEIGHDKKGFARARNRGRATGRGGGSGARGTGNGHGAPTCFLRSSNS